jgi:hypothetical protein
VQAAGARAALRAGRAAPGRTRAAREPNDPVPTQPDLEETVPSWRELDATGGLRPRVEPAMANGYPPSCCAYRPSLLNGACPRHIGPSTALAAMSSLEFEWAAEAGGELPAPLTLQPSLHGGRDRTDPAPYSAQKRAMIPGNANLTWPTNGLRRSRR